MGDKMKDLVKKNRKIILIYSLLVLVATCFVLLFSISTSPIYYNYYSYGGPVDGGDSLHFQTDGYSWLHGKVPYRDFFDHKGPIIFLVNMLGFLFGGGTRYGIMILQVISLSVVLIYAWKISQLAKKSNLWGAVCIGFMLIFMLPLYNVGNSVQEYNLPFIMVSMYYLVRYFYAAKQSEHNPWWAFIYGVCIGACVLLQLTHAIPICAGVLVVGIVLIKQKLWKNLGQNILFGLAGFMAIWLPFALYFLFNGAFGDFIFCSVVYNFSYAKNNGSWINGATGGTIQNILIVYIPLFCAMLTSILAFVRKKYAYSGMLLIISVLELYLLVSTQPYGHYTLPFVTQIVLFLNELIWFKHQDEAKQLCYVAMVCITSFLAYNIATGRAATLVDQYKAVRDSAKIQTDDVKLMERHIDDIRKSSFTLYYGDPDLKGFYVRYGIVPYNRFFIIQTWCASFDDKVKEETHADLKDNRAEYLMSMPVFTDDDELGIRDVLDEYYEKIDSEGEYIMYQLKEAK